MLNRTGITKVTGAAPTQILFNVDNQMSVSIKVSKNVTAFVNAVDNSKPAVGVLLHDVDVTDADANGSLLIWGFVNMSRLSTGATTLLTATRQTELSGKIWFLKD